MRNRLYSFVGGAAGAWRVLRMESYRGEALPVVPRIGVVEDSSSELFANHQWILRGIVSNERYVTRSEKQELVSIQPSLGRLEATCAALIPIKKADAWWQMAQDERRRIFEEQSKHIQIGMKSLPAVARKLHHCRDLPTNEPFDFLTWFEYSPADAAAFDDLLSQLRQTLEWTFVTREIDIRLERD